MTGSARVIVLWILGAVGAGGGFAWRLYSQGNTDVGYEIGMALCFVIAIAIVAPKAFLGGRDAADWSQETKELRSRYTPRVSDTGETRSRDTQVGADRDAA
jgi:hypothetical protein